MRLSSGVTWRWRYSKSFNSKSEKPKLVLKGFSFPAHKNTNSYRFWIVSVFMARVCIDFWFAFSHNVIRQPHSEEATRGLTWLSLKLAYLSNSDLNKSGDEMSQIFPLIMRTLSES